MSIQDRFQETFGNVDARRWLSVEDRLQLVGLAAGLFVVAVGLGTLVGMPWQYYDSIAITVGRILGTIGTIAIGLGIIWLTKR